MGKGLWFVAGAGAGVYAVARARRLAEAFTPEGLRDRVSGLGVAARIFAAEMRAGTAERETQLRERLGLMPHGLPELEPARVTVAGEFGEEPAGPTNRRGAGG